MKTGKYAVVIFICLVFMPVYVAADYSVILKRNIFTEPPPPPKPEVPTEKTPIIKPPPPPELGSLIDLKGIIYFPEGGSFAVIGIKKGNKEDIYKEGSVVENAEIVKVYENEVVFRYQGKEERIGLKKESTQSGFMEVVPGVTAKTTPTKPADEKSKIINPTVTELPKFEEPVVVKFKETIAELKKDKELLKNLNVIPNVQEGKVEGFKISNIPVGSLPYQYGVRNGDVVRRVNGVFIDSMATGFSVYNQIVKNGTDIVTVEVLRNNSPIVLTFKLK